MAASRPGEYRGNRIPDKTNLFSAVVAICIPCEQHAEIASGEPVSGKDVENLTL